MRMWTTMPLQQRVTAVAYLLWGIDRLSSGYRGPTVRVRRASDSTTLDCYNAAQVASFCAGTNGFVTIIYNQASNGASYDGGLVASNPPKIYDSSTGHLVAGKTRVMSFAAGTSDMISTSGHPLPVGSPALTSGVWLGSWPTSATDFPLWQCGSDNAAERWQMFHNSSTTLVTVNFLFGGSRTFNVTATDSAANYLVAEKALNANATAISLRQNKSACTQNAVIAGTQNLQTGATFLGGNSFVKVTATVAFLAHFPKLSTADLDSFEQEMERMRVA